MSRLEHFRRPDFTRLDRRAFLGRAGLGFGGMALGAMLARDGFASDGSWQPPTGVPHFAPRAKSVIWLFMRGGVSHMESFDPKPALTDRKHPQAAAKARTDFVQALLNHNDFIVIR